MTSRQQGVNSNKLHSRLMMQERIDSSNKKSQLVHTASSKNLLVSPLLSSRYADNQKNRDRNLQTSKHLTAKQMTTMPRTPLEIGGQI